MKQNKRSNRVLFCAVSFGSSSNKHFIIPSFFREVAQVHRFHVATFSILPHPVVDVLSAVIRQDMRVASARVLFVCVLFEEALHRDYAVYNMSAYMRCRMDCKFRFL